MLDLTKPEIQTLITSLNKRKAFVIAGAGVSSASIDPDSRKIFGTWTNLLRYGIAFCCEKCRREATWGDTCRTFLDNEHATTEELLKIGDEIWDCLLAHGKVQEWLDIFDNALPEYRELILAIKGLGVPIATANYDNLLEDITHLTPITLHETQKVEDFIKNDQKQKYILHLHGYYKKPDSIVLGQKSYDRIVQDEFAQFINRYLITAYDTVIFLGFGQGVYDQNFSLIFKWASAYLRKTKLYHIVLNKYVDETKQTHQNNGNPNVVVLGYGENYNDLTPFINALAHTVEHHDDLPKTLEGKPICLGKNRLDLVETVAQYLVTHYKKPMGILGTGGVGKTNLVLNVLHHEAVARKYRRNRFFVRCDGAKDLALLQNALINALEMPVSSGDLGDRILNYLSHQDNRFLIALDNFETAWQDKTKVESFIEKLKDYADLVFTYRGNASPDELDWKVFQVPFLNEKDAIALFNENSGEKFIGNPLVKTMVQGVDGLPLAVELLAKRAKKVEKIEDLYRQWEKTRNDFLSKGGNKNTNLNLSISFSYENTRLSDDNRAFLQALGYLPQGMNRTYLETIFDDAYDQIEILKEVGLCEETEQARLWILTPIREYLKLKTAPDHALIAQIQDFYLDLSQEQGEKAHSENQGNQILQAQWANIIKVITDTLTTQKGIGTLFSLTLYCQFTGFYPTNLFKKAVEIAHQNQWETDKANCLKSLGDLAFRESENALARQYFQAALPLYEKIGALLGKANCLRSLGNLAFRESENALARQYFQVALPLYEKIGALLGKANCLRSLGDLAFLESENALARQYFQEALPLYEKIGDLLGKANCLRSLGDLAFLESENALARQYFQEALPLYEKIGDLLGKANCLSSLGDLAFRESENEKGNELYQNAILLYQKLNDHYSVGWAYYSWSFKVPDKKKEYQCMAKKVWFGAKLDYLVKQVGLTDLDCA